MTDTKKKILVITPKMPFPKTGACEQDRGWGIEDLVRLGYDVRVIAKASVEKVSHAAVESARLGIPLTAIPYTSSASRHTPKKILKRLVSPWLWDGAAVEYYDPAIQDEVKRALDEFNPDLVWFDYTYLWPLYSLVKKKRIPIITRSINFEPHHFLGEEGVSFVNLLKFLPKLLSEFLTVWKSDLILAITPREEQAYKRMGAAVKNLPLRGLPHVLAEKRRIMPHDPVHVFFFGSTYNVSHNRHALEFILFKIVPLAEKKAPGSFVFHILGSKMPEDLRRFCTGSVMYEGYVSDLDAFVVKMDIALMPSFIGARGMQGKIFEPLARGVPLITNSQALAGYPFEASREYLAATSEEEFVHAMIALKDPVLRAEISSNSIARCRELFSQNALDAILAESINSLI